MQAALDAVAKMQLGKTYPLVIDGQAITTAATGSTRSTRRTRSRSSAAAARRRRSTPSRRSRRRPAAFPAWRDTPAERARRASCVKAAEIMRRRRFELAAWEVYECGKPWREADADVAEAIDFCDYYAREMLRLAAPQRRDVPGEDNDYFYEPRGVAVVIAPWNFPLAILCGMTTAALVTGNTVIMKPAEQSSVIAAKLMEVFQEAGLPPGVVNYLPGVGEEIGPTLVEPSRRGADRVHRLAERRPAASTDRRAETPRGQDHVKRVIAEMGGKNAIIVDDDADLDEAVQGVVDSAFGYQGQKCSACSRAIVLEPHLRPVPAAAGRGDARA